MITLPGLIDIHVHLRDPGQIQKEDFYTGTSAALAGGFTTIIDMPNNIVPITTHEKLTKKIDIAKTKIVCDLGFYFGSLGDNIDEFPSIYSMVKGIKMYLNETTGNYLVNTDILNNVYHNWKSDKPILVHAEEDVIGSVVETVKKYGRRTHVCHVSSQNELSIIIKAKENGLPITCGVCPHHLYLTDQDVLSLGSFGQMKPSLKTKNDQDFLWRNLKYVDVIESDHAPHTKKEKADNPAPSGVAGLETTLPLLLTSVSEGRIPLERVIELCHTNPARIFDIPIHKTTKVEVNLEEEWIINDKDLKTKCKWSPFIGFKVKGKVKNVFIRGTKALANNEVLVNAGFGRVI